MTLINYDVIATGSKGNALVIDNKILVDCGVSFKKLNLYYKNLKLVLLTHIHSDHFNKSTIKKLSKERPTLRFACGEFLHKALIDCGVPDENIDILQEKQIYGYGICTVCPVRLIHNVLNYGYKISIGDCKVLYATDTNEIDHVVAKDYDYYFIECNYEDDEIRKRIAQKELEGKYVYEYDVLNNHLSKAKCDKWLLDNAGDSSKIIKMHMHED